MRCTKRRVGKLAAVVVGAVAVFSAPTSAYAFGLPGQVSPKVAVTRSANDVTTKSIAPGAGSGYWQFASDGGVFAYGDAGFAGSAVGLTDSPIVAVAKTSTGAGYWMVNDLGGVFSFGDAQFYGSAHDLKLNAPITGIARSQGGHGYYLVAADGGVFAYGDAVFHGSAADLHVNTQKIKFSAITLPNVVTSLQLSTNGYWLNAWDGGVYAYNAPFYGTAHTYAPRFPVIGLQPSASGSGYWQLSSDGGIFSFGDAAFHGSAVTDMQIPLAISIDRSATSLGYWITDLLGHVYSKGDAVGYGQASTLTLRAPVISVVRSGP